MFIWDTRMFIEVNLIILNVPWFNTCRCMCMQVKGTLDIKN